MPSYFGNATESLKKKKNECQNGYHSSGQSVIQCTNGCFNIEELPQSAFWRALPVVHMCRNRCQSIGQSLIQCINGGALKWTTHDAVI